MKTVILAAGKGTRLGKPHPKPLTELVNGNTIIGQQTQLISSYLDKNDLMVVVGFMKEHIMDSYPSAMFIFNPRYGETNTSKSLLEAIKHVKGEGVLWMNGDVVFEDVIMERVSAKLKEDRSFVLVNNAKVADEEVKYTLDESGKYINKISKEVKNALGECVGINYIASADLELFKQHLDKVNDNDYFEKGLENAILNDGLKMQAVDISDCLCMEVDFPEDLVQANDLLTQSISK